MNDPTRISHPYRCRLLDIHKSKAAMSDTILAGIAFASTLALIGFIIWKETYEVRS